jgi:hypothetical protein
MGVISTFVVAVGAFGLKNSSSSAQGSSSQSGAGKSIRAKDFPAPEESFAPKVETSLECTLPFSVWIELFAVRG